MRKIIFILTMLPCIVFGQMKQLNLETHNISLKLDGDYSSSLLEILGLSDDYSFVIDNNIRKNYEGEQHLFFNQYYLGIPIEHSSIRLHYKGDLLYYINGTYVDNILVGNIPVISEGIALQYALESVNAESFIWDYPEELERLNQIEPVNSFYPQPTATLTYYSQSYGENPQIHLTFKYDIIATNPFSRYHVYIDALSGEVIAKHTQIYSVGTGDTRYSGTRALCTNNPGAGSAILLDNTCSRTNIHTWNAQTNPTNFPTFPNSIDFTDNDNNWTAAEYNNAAKDNAAIEAHWAMGRTYDYFKAQHGRESYDDYNSPVNLYVHANQNWGNAQYWGGGTMVFGDGSNFDAYVSLDIIAHEFGHGVTSSMGGLNNQMESGAINESISDIWGAAVEHWADGSKQWWKIGEDIMVNGAGLRDMLDPNSKGDPDTYGGTFWYNQNGCIPVNNPNDPNYNDGCGVHTNSNVMNRWFSLLAAGGSGTNDHGWSYNVTSMGLYTPSYIVYRAMDLYMTYNTNFASARVATLKAAADIHGSCSNEVENVANAWHAVGVGSPAPPNMLLLNYPISNQQYHEAYNSTMSSHIHSTADVTVKVAEFALMIPGMQTHYGTKLLVFPSGCLNIVGAKPGKAEGSHHDDNYAVISDLHNLDKRAKTTPEDAKNDNIDRIPLTPHIYPNPTTGSFNIEIPQQGNYTIRVLNILGTTVYEGKMTDEQQKSILLDNNLPPGNYTLHISGDRLRHVERITLTK